MNHSQARPKRRYRYPVRDRETGIVRWPGRDLVVQAAQESAEAMLAAEPRITAIVYFGSYARGDWGVGSDLDLIVVVDLPPAEQTDVPLLMRKHELPWTDLIDLPVPHDLFVYTPAELKRVGERSPRYLEMLRNEAAWFIGGPP